VYGVNNCFLIQPPLGIGKKWCDGRRGFSKQAFDSVSRKSKEKDVFCNIVIDEMSIREQMIFSNNKFYGGVDMGTNDAMQEKENPTLANITH
jgi:hypothetical protein